MAEQPVCPNCNNLIERALDLPYGWWEWRNGDGGGFKLSTAATRVDVAPWVHDRCMGELRDFHPHDYPRRANA